jgi:catechol 1,2-dioxygenase
VGRLLTATGRHPYRPAHIHFIVAADGHLPVTTHIFVAGSPYLDSDAVFAVKQRLITDFARVDDPDQAAAFGVEAPFRHAQFDVILQPTPDQGPG